VIEAPNAIVRDDAQVRCDVVLRCVSAACLPPDTTLALHADANSTVPIEFIAYETDYGEVGTGELVCHVRGEAEDLEAGGTMLGNAGIRNLQVLAMASNAAVLSPHIHVAYEPHPGGQFMALRTLGSDPQGARRTIDVDRTLRLIEALARHPKERRLLLAATNYGESLRRSHATASVHAALHLWMAVENLTEVVTHRLRAEHGAADLEELGEALGVQARENQPRERYEQHVRGTARRREVFGGDDATHRALKEASDGVEHGYMNFGEARTKIDGIFPTAAALIRRSLLRESGIASDDLEVLMTGIFTRPLPLWRPQIVAEGDFARDTAFDYSRPIHLRVEGNIQVEEISADQHATAMSLSSHVRTSDGLEVFVRSVGLAAPGEIRFGAADESGAMGGASEERSEG
jgi:hypothetical protein